MPYKPTGRPNGRPRIHPLAEAIADRERRAEAATAHARHHQRIADSMIADELRTKTYRQLASELDVTEGHLRHAVRRARKQQHQ
jgi:hypothetical protein